MKIASEIKSYLSLLFIVSALLSVVFLKMEARRIGYDLLKLSRMEKSLKDDRRKQELLYAKLIRPGRIEQIAKSSLDLKKAGRGRVVQLFMGRSLNDVTLTRVQ